MGKRASFGGRLGVLLVAAGSAVGLGNIWRFPCELGQNGGGAFLLIYLVCAVVIGLPIMLAEFSLGRMGQSNVVGTFRRVSGTNKYRWIGYAGVLCALLIMGCYGGVCGWTLDYVYQAVAHGFS
ncbi:MAG: sodium-dependent transporter, partial [Paludibacteraceae bacterium]|nr:sodium-dependent transporter [Paludibacteraceae bacterium]